MIDDYYETFVERVSDGRDLEPEFVRDTEARIYLGESAHELDLVDELGTRRDVEAVLAERLETDEVTVEEFEPERPLVARMGAGARSVAYAFGAGIAGLAEPRSFGCDPETVCCRQFWKSREPVRERNRRCRAVWGGRSTSLANEYVVLSSHRKEQVP